MRAHAEARVVVHPADEHLLAAHGVDVHAVAEREERDVVPRPEGGIAQPTGNRKRESAWATVFTEISSSKIAHLPSVRGPFSFANARRTRSGVIGSSVTQTPIAS